MSRKNRTDVVAAARIMFAEKGFHGTSMRDLGKKLGLMGSSLYSHVVSKDELLVDVVREASSRFQALADEVTTMSGTANERLSRLVHGHLHILVEDPHQARTFLNETRFLPEPERDKAVTMFDRYQQVFRDVLSNGCAAGEFRSDLDVHLAANLVLSLLNGTQRWFNADGALNVDSLALEVHYLLTLGLNPNPKANVA